MNNSNQAPDLRFPGELSQFLDALNQLYRCLGLQPEDARAATFADAEIFVPETVESALQSA